MAIDNFAALLRGRENELAALYENVPGIVFYIAVEPGGEFRFQAVSRDFLVATGLTREQIVGSLVRDVIPPESRDVVLNRYRQAISSGETVRWEEESVYPAGRRYGEVAVRPLFDGGVATHLIGIVHDITERKRFEKSHRENGDKQAFLLRLSDALRSATDPPAMVAMASRLLGEHLQVDRVAYADIEGDTYITRGSWDSDSVFRLRRGGIAAFGKTRLEALRRGGTISSEDVTADPRFADSEQENFHVFEIRAFVSIGLTKSGQWVGAFGVHSRTPRQWVRAEIELIQEVAERSWSAAEHARATAVIRRAEEVMRANETLLRVFVENSPTIIWLKDEEGRHVFHSPAYDRQFGLRSRDWQGKTDFDLWPKEIAEQFRQNDRAAMEADEPIEVLESKLAEDGAISWWLNKKFWFRDASGRRFVGGIGLNITARRRVEEALRQSEERLRLAAEATGFATFDYDAGQRMKVFSPELLTILDLPHVKAAADIDLVRFIHPDDLQRHTAARANSLDPCGSGNHDVEFRLVRPDGEIRWIREASHTLFEGKGESRKPVRVIGTLLDVTDLVRLRQHLEMALHRTDSQLMTIVKAAPIGIVVTDRKGKISTWNDSAERIFGYRADEVLSRVDPSIPGDALQAFRDCLSAVTAGTTVQIEEQRIRKDKSIIQVAVVHAPHRDEHGAVRGIITLVEDITEKRNTEKALAHVRAGLAELQLEEARRVARELHDDISQRLAIVFLDIQRLLTESPHSHDQLAASVGSLQRKITEISDGVRGISHRMHPAVLEHLGLPSALKHLFHDFSQREGIPVKFDSDKFTISIPLIVASCLYRIAQEALRNISKHAKASDVAATLTRAGEDINFCIIDSGVGFDMSFETSGLGVHSMRERVTLVNGSFSIASEPGSGTRIEVAIPLPAPHAENSGAFLDGALEPSAAVTGDRRKCRVLIGDDHPIFTAGVAKLLENTCQVLETAENGLALAEAAERLRPDLILIDISMPLMNGFDAARRIRKSLPHAKLLFLTTYADTAFADEAFEAGANGYLVKQAAWSELPKAIAAVLGGHRYRSAAVRSLARGGTP